MYKERGETVVIFIFLTSSYLEQVVAPERHFHSPCGSFDSDTILTDQFPVYCLELERSGKREVLNLALQLGRSKRWSPLCQPLTGSLSKGIMGCGDAGTDIGNSYDGCCDRASVAVRAVWIKLGGTCSLHTTRTCWTGWNYCVLYL